MNTACMYTICLGPNKGVYCLATIQDTAEFCIFHTSLIKRRTDGNKTASWAHYVKPNEDHSKINYENVPKRSFYEDEYQMWLEGWEDASESGEES